jgi:hypothetical protein
MTIQQRLPLDPLTLTLTLDRWHQVWPNFLQDPPNRRMDLVRPTGSALFSDFKPTPAPQQRSLHVRGQWARAAQRDGRKDSGARPSSTEGRGREGSREGAIFLDQLVALTSVRLLGSNGRPKTKVRRRWSRGTAPQLGKKVGRGVGSAPGGGGGGWAVFGGCWGARGGRGAGCGGGGRGGAGGGGGAGGCAALRQRFFGPSRSRGGEASTEIAS